MSKKKSLVKQICICCEEKGKKTNKEHIFPQWILKKTNTFNNPIIGTAGNKEIPGKHCVIPICEDCNSELSRELEDPVSRLFDRVENNKGFNDYEAELLVRWMWKITGMFYWIQHAETQSDYSFITLKDRCTSYIEESRQRISIAISLIENEKSAKYEDTAMGLDIVPYHSNVLAVGVFNKIALIVYYSQFAHLVPDIYTKYQLSANTVMMNPDYIIKPITSFVDQQEAINITRALASTTLLVSHERIALENRLKFEMLIKENHPSIPEEVKALYKKAMKNG